MRAEVDRRAVVEAVASVVDPCSIATGHPISLVDMGMLLSVDLSGTRAAVTLALTSPVCLQAMNIVDAVESAVLEVDGVEEATCRIEPTAEWDPAMIDPEATRELRRLRPPPAHRRSDRTVKA
jgi:metal-sulfur cluster biosynthetic enzyme